MTSSLRLVALLFLVPAACNHGEVASAAPSPSPAAAPVRLAPAIHGSEIAMVAALEDGSAALTADSIGELRLWPTLDGKRPPVPVDAPSPTQLALATAGSELLAAIRDHAGGVTLLRLDRDGTPRGRMTLASDVTAVRVIAIRDGVLVWRSDQSIARYDATGALHGRVVTDPGQHVVAIGARHGAAFAMVSSAGDPLASRALRWLAIDTAELRWGTTVTLAEAVAAPVALSPDHRHLAARAAAQRTIVRMYELGATRANPSNAKPPAAATLVAEQDAQLGFTTDTTLAILGAALTWWELAPPVTPAASDPWAPQGPRPPPPSPIAAHPSAGDAALVDGRAIVGAATALALATPQRTRYLGYRALFTSIVTPLDDGFAASGEGAQIVWLDRELHIVREVELRAHDPTASYALVVGPHHVIVYRMDNNQFKFELVDTDQPKRTVAIGTYPALQRLEYLADAHVLALTSKEGRVERIAIDVGRHAVTHLPALASKLGVTMVKLLDPARAGGVVALVTGYSLDPSKDGSELRVAVFRDDKPDAHGAIAAATTSKLTNGTAVGADASGNLYTFVPGPQGAELVIRRDGKESARTAIEGATGVGAVDHAGTRVAMLRGHSSIVMLDAGGHELWRHPMWSALDLTFSADDRLLLARTSRGLALLDALTGKRVGSACAWAFALADTAPPIGTYGQSPTCVDLDR